jgi:hypothetical protein
MDRTLNISNVSMAPDRPGIYAWYAEIKVGLPDWIGDHNDEQDLGATRLRKALDAFSSYFTRHRLNVEARSYFSTRWRGDLEDIGRTAQSRAVTESLQAADRRELLVSVISSACPVFTNPLYIGVADSLRQRLKQHSEEYFGLRDAQRNAPDAFAEYGKQETFAQRAFRLGLKEENLKVFLKPIEVIGNLDREAVRETLEAGEWLLNQWSTPLLGRK